jgi:hypothetical protein
VESLVDFSVRVLKSAVHCPIAARGSTNQTLMSMNIPTTIQTAKPSSHQHKEIKTSNILLVHKNDGISFQISLGSVDNFVLGSIHSHTADSILEHVAAIHEYRKGANSQNL